MEQGKSDQINLMIHKIINTSDIEKALEMMHAFLEKFLPFLGFNLFVYNSNRGTIRYLAFSTREKTLFGDEPVKLSNAGRADAEQGIADMVKITNNTDESALSRDVIAHFNLSGIFSTAAIFSEIRPAEYGVIAFIDSGKNCFDEKHFRFLNQHKHSISSMAHHVLSKREIANLTERLTLHYSELRRRLGFLNIEQIIGEESGLRDVMHQASQVAPFDIPVLIDGETGVGKELIANAIHNMSRRSDQPLVSLNCGAIPETLFESELFGYERGAFSGADQMKTGYFDQADGGTLFFDEIGEMPLQSQVKLLRVLQDMKFYRVGGTRPISVNVRIIAATNRNLEDMAEMGIFRKDLWFRLSVFPIHVPPLRDRKEDIPKLAEYFAEKQCTEINLPYKPVFALEAMGQLQRYHWPGNIRELKNIIERALILSRGQPMVFPDLSSSQPDMPETGLENAVGAFPTLNEVISEHIQKALRISKGRIEGRGGSAELLDMHPSTLRARMKKLGIRLRTIPERS